MAATPIDRDKLHVFVRNQDHEALLNLLDRAIDLLPKTKLAKLFEGRACPEELRPDSPSPAGLVAAVKRFHAASLSGEYYEDFNVNSKNFMDMSKGTETWIAECCRLTVRGVAVAKKGNHTEAREALELIFELLREIDEGGDEIIFFADEAGSWQVGIDWDTVLPAWFQCLAASESAEEYAVAVREVIEEFASYHAKPLLKAAGRVATKEQRAALVR